MTSVPETLDANKKIAVVLLAAGFGTRIKKDLTNDPQFFHLADTPKPLLPLAGKPLISHWLPSIANISNLCNVTLITNAAHYPAYCSWARSLDQDHPQLILPPITVLCNSVVDNDTRFGSVHDLHIALSSISRFSPEAHTALVIAGDTLLPNVDVACHIENFNVGDEPIAVFSYQLSDMKDSARRGMLAVEGSTSSMLIAKGLIEKPATPDLAPSPWATAPVYLFRKHVWNELSAFLSERCRDDISTRDAPGLLLSWLIPRFRCRVFPVPTRIDIGCLQHYKDALFQYTTPPLPLPDKRAASEPAIGRAYPRIGILGNPSDMYRGHVVAVAIVSEGYAEVIATPSESFSIVPNEDFELPRNYTHLMDLVHTIENYGVHYGARNLVLAATVAFVRKWVARHREGDSVLCNLNDLPGCRLSYSTSIPQRVGLSGSSALILASWRALARFFNASLEQIDPDQSAWVTLLRDVEAKELGITCGLMDRVVQVMHGCVSMDFSKGEPGLWSALPEHGLPDMYILFRRDRIGNCSGSVHGLAKKSIDPKDSRKSATVSELARGAVRGAEIITLRASDGTVLLEELCTLLDRNFDLRCELLGSEAVGKDNINLVSTARRYSFAAKLTGSGGCVLCVPRPGSDVTDESIQRITSECNSNGLAFRKVSVLNGLEWRI